jgi:hypothetical protein
MSNRSQNQNLENLLFNYLLNHADQGSTDTSSPIVEQDTPANPLTDRSVSLLLRVFDSYQRNVEIYHRNMENLIRLLRVNMNTPRQPAPIQRETRPRSWYVPYATRQSAGDPSNNSIPPAATRSPIYSSATATYATTYAIPPRTTRTPTYSSSNANSTSSLRANNRLTDREIERNVSTITYSSDETETRCPISFEDFCVGESICKINTCGHIFKREPLYQWLNNHNTCPVCRANVVSTTSNFRNNIINEYSNYIAYTLLSGLNTNPSNIQTYTFDLPIYYDTSGNAGASNISNNYDYIVEEEDDTD